MGAMAELRPIIVIGSIIAMIIILVGIMPQELFNAQTQSLNTNPSNTSWNKLLATNETMFFNLTGGTYDFGNKDFGGWHLDLQERDSDKGRVLWIQIADAWYNYFYSREDFNWYANDSITYVGDFTLVYHIPYSTFQQVVSLTTLNVSSISTYVIKSSKTTITVYFFYDISYYTNLYSAYNAGNLTLIMGINFDERNTQINAWTVVGSLLTFQLIPNCDPVLALIIEVPLWLAEIYVVFILVLRVIGAVFGGGGA